MRKRRTSAITNTAKETVQKTTAKVSGDIKDFMNEPAVQEATETVREVAKKAEAVVTEVSKAASTKIGAVHLEIFETNVSMDDVKKAVKKDVADKGLSGNIEIYLNAEERAAYYTVDGVGSAEYKIDLKSL
jgi:hypothetical protein